MQPKNSGFSLGLKCCTLFHINFNLCIFVLFKVCSYCLFNVLILLSIDFLVNRNIGPVTRDRMWYLFSLKRNYNNKNWKFAQIEQKGSFSILALWSACYLEFASKLDQTHLELIPRVGFSHPEHWITSIATGSLWQQYKIWFNCLFFFVLTSSHNNCLSSIFSQFYSFKLSQSNWFFKVVVGQLPIFTAPHITVTARRRQFLKGDPTRYWQPDRLGALHDCLVF